MPAQAPISLHYYQILIFVADPPFLRPEDENSAMLDENLHLSRHIGEARQRS